MAEFTPSRRRRFRIAAIFAVSIGITAWGGAATYSELAAFRVYGAAALTMGLMLIVVCAFAVTRVSIVYKRRLQFGLRTMFVLVTAFAVWLGWGVQSVQQRRDTIRTIERRGGYVQVQERIKEDRTYAASVPRWREWLGDEAVVSIYVPLDFKIGETMDIQALYPEAIVGFPPPGGIPPSKPCHARKSEL